MPTIAKYPRFTDKEIKRLAEGRERTKESTYCQDAAVWLADICAAYLTQPGNMRAELDQVLKRLLDHFRPTKSRFVRSPTKRTGVELSETEAGKVDVARGEALDGTAFVYIASLLRAEYDVRVRQLPTLGQVLAASGIDREEVEDGGGEFELSEGQG